MILSYVQLLLVCFGFWSSREAVARALRQQWVLALPFGGIALLCLLIPKSGWFLLALVDGALLIVARRTEGLIQCCSEHPPKPRPWHESNWRICLILLVPLVLWDALKGQLVLGNSLAAWLVAWFPLIALSGGMSALFVRNDPMPSPIRATSFSECLKSLHTQVRRMWHAFRLPPPLNLEVASLNFFESGSEVPKAEQRRYAWSFPQETTRNIMLEVKVHILKSKWCPIWRCPFVCRYYKPDGSLLAEVRSKWLIIADWQRYSFTWGWGWPYPGQWRPGVYRVELLIDGGQVAKASSFTIKPPPPPPPPPTPAEVLHHASVRFYASRPGYAARQDRIRFPQETTREVVCKLTVQNLLYRQRDRTYPVTAQCYTPEAKLLWESHQSWLIKSDEQEPSISWGWQPPGQWEAGAYRVEILIGGAEFAWGAFAIE